MQRKIKLIFNLFLSQSVVVLLPNWIWGNLSNWKPWLAFLLFVLLFANSIRREWLYGNLADRKTDHQTKSTGSTLSYLYLFGGIFLSLWLSVYDHYHHLLSLPRPDFIEILGLIFMVSGVVLNTHAAAILGQFYDRLSISENHQLVKNGVYKFIRHPIYTSYYFLFSGFCLFYFSLGGFLLLTFVYFSGYANRIKIEEALLLETFNEEYKTYMQQTWRLIPFIY